MKGKSDNPGIQAAGETTDLSNLRITISLLGHTVIMTVRQPLLWLILNNRTHGPTHHLNFIKSSVRFSFHLTIEASKDPCGAIMSPRAVVTFVPDDLAKLPYFKFSFFGFANSSSRSGTINKLFWNFMAALLTNFKPTMLSQNSRTYSSDTVKI